MSDPFDPVDQWLGTDVELLPPPSGAFERIHRRARRRKTVVALATAAGAAVAITAAVTLPQLVSVPQPGHGGGTYNIESAAPSSHAPRPSHYRSTSPAPSHSPTASPATSAPTGSNLSISSPGGPPTPGIAPSSVTFVSGTVGAVIGETTSGCPLGCEAVAATSDYGQNWSKVDPPPAGPPDGNSGVSQIRFLEASNGWAFGPELYATHDGGATWTKIKGLHGRVIDLVTVNASAYAVVASCTGTGSDYASGCTRFALYTSAFSSDSFQPVTGGSGTGRVQPGGLQLTRTTGYLLAGDVLFSGVPDGGSAWRAIKISSGAVPACLAAQGHSVAPGESGLLAPSTASEVYLLCQSPGGGGGSLYASTDSGATWQLDGHVTARGIATSLAVAPGSGTLVLATNAGIYYSPDARRWHRASLPGQAPFGGFGFVGMTTQPNGVAVPAAPGSAVIYITTDGGLHWHAKRIS